MIAGISQDTGERLAQGRASGFVLAGGRSRRLGFDKALIRTRTGETLLERAFGLLTSRCEDVHVVVDRAGRPLPSALSQAALCDQHPGLGPLGGLYTGLSAARHDSCLVLACDLPFVLPELLDLLLGCAPWADALVPRALGRAQPLAAAYRRTCLPAIEASLQAGELALEQFLRRVQTSYLDEGKLLEVDPDLRSFFNINSPTDLETAIAMGL